MKNQDIATFALTLAKLGETYKEQITETLSETFWSMLKEFDISAVVRAVNNYMADPDNEQRMPKPGDIRGWIIGLGKNRALLAWSKVMNAIQQVGAYDSVVFDDALIHAVISAMGGWVTLCQTKRDEIPFVAREFQKYYLAFLREPPKQLPTQVHGIFPSSPPKVIGHIDNAHLALKHSPHSLAPSEETNKANKMTPKKVLQYEKTR